MTPASARSDAAPDTAAGTATTSDTAGDSAATADGAPTTADGAAGAPLAEETTDDVFSTMVARLNRLSVDTHFDAYADVDWDSPELALDAADPLLEVPDFDPLSATDWYRAQPGESRARIGLYRYAACMKIGWHFENVLQRGLLLHASGLPNGAPEFRYLHHELIEESQHTLMFQEFINRSGLPVRGLPRFWRVFATLFVVPLSRVFPELFFVFVLGGEDPVDHVQRLQLRGQRRYHPLVERIMRIHVTEEARHLSFARHFLSRRVPRLGFARRQAIALAAPVILGVMTRLMLFPPGDLLRHCGVPRSVARSAFRSPEGRRLLRDSIAKTRRVCVELGLVNPLSRLAWRAAGIWDEPATRSTR